MRKMDKTVMMEVCKAVEEICKRTNDVHMAIYQVKQRYPDLTIDQIRGYYYLFKK